MAALRRRLDLRVLAISNSSENFDRGVLILLIVIYSNTGSNF